MSMTSPRAVFRQAFPFGKSPSRDVKAAIAQGHRSRQDGNHHAQEGDPDYKVHLTPRLAKAWQTVKRLQARRTRHNKGDITDALREMAR